MKRFGSILLTLSLLTTGLCLPAWGAEPIAPRVITLEEAQAMALKRSYGLNTKEQNIIRAGEAFEQAKDTADILRVGTASGDSVADMMSKSALVGQISFYNQTMIAEKQFTIEQETLQFTVRALCDDIRKTSGQFEVMKLKNLYDQRMANLVGLKMMFGLESEFNAENAQDDFKVQTTLKKQLEQSLATSYTKLNRLIGLHDSERYVLSYDVEFQPLEEKTPTIQVGADPYMWMLTKQADVDKVRLTLYTLSDNVVTRDESYAGREAKSRITNNAYNDTSGRLQEAVKTRFNQIKQLEEQKSAAQIKVARAEKALKMARLQFQVGFGTALDVQGAELAWASAKQEFDETVLSHATLVLMYKKPYLVPDYLSPDFTAAMGS